MNIGIMQGRLTTEPNGIYQRHPYKWEKELYKCKQHGIKRLEWIVDQHSEDFNPIRNEEGRMMVRELCKTNEVEISSICADILLDYSDIEANGSQWTNILSKCLEDASSMGVGILVIPLIEGLTLRDGDRYKRMLERLNECAANFENITLALSLIYIPQKYSNF